MKATSVTHIENTIIDLITQRLCEKIKEAGSQIHDALSADQQSVLCQSQSKTGRKKRGPQNRGEHLFLSLMGFIHKVEPTLAFRAIKLAVLAPSFDTASKILAEEAIVLSPKKIRQMVTQMASVDPSSRVERLLGDKEDRPFKKQDQKN